MLRSVNATNALPIATAPLAADGEIPPAVWLVGAHGGAGVTTLAQAWAPMGDAGTCWPNHDEFPYAVLVCESSLSGLASAHRAALQALDRNSSVNCELLGVVIVDRQPGKLPKPLHQSLKRLENLVAKADLALWRVGFVARWRVTPLADIPQWIPDNPPLETKRKDPVKAIHATGETIFNLAADREGKKNA